MRPLQPPKNYRPTEARCCETCKHLVFSPGYAECERPGGPGFDVGDRQFLWHVCSLWRSLMHSAAQAGD